MVESESDPRVPAEGVVHTPDFAMKCGPLEAGASRVRGLLPTCRPKTFHGRRAKIDLVKLNSEVFAKVRERAEQRRAALLRRINKKPGRK